MAEDSYELLKQTERSGTVIPKSEDELRKSRIEGIREMLPSWMYKEELATMYQKSGGRSAFVLGPACKIVFFTNGLAMFTLLIFFFVVWNTAKCSGAIATYPLWAWSVMVPFAVAHTFAEFKVLQYYLIPYIDLRQVAKKPIFTIASFSTSFKYWFVFYRLISTSNLLDYATDSGFAGSVLKGTHCPHNKVEEYWTRLWESSILGQLNCPLPSAQQTVMIAWLVSFLPNLFAIISTSRVYLSDGDVPDELGNAGRGVGCCGQQMNNENIVREVGDASGMATVGILSLQFVGEKISQSIEAGKLGKGQMRRFVSVAKQIVVARMLFSYLFETALQLNVQITLFAFDVFASGGITIALSQVLLSIIVSIGTAALKLSEAFAFFTLAARVSNHFAHTKILDSELELVQLVAIFKRYLWAARFIFTLYALAVVYALCKLVAIGICRDHVWNLTGCVDLRT